MDNSPQGLALGVLLALLIFGSVLVHELGHALVARRFHLYPIDITLNALGGYTRHGGSRTATQGVLVTLAGPGASFLLAVVFFGLAMVVPNGRLAGFCGAAASMNFGWTIFNLLPMYPLDGGQVVFHLLSYRIHKNRALKWAARLGVLTGAVIGGWAILNQEWWVVGIVVLSLARSVPLAFGD